MVKYSPDVRYILAANEGEPREGYGTGAVDPKGSITVIDTQTHVSVNYGFENINRDQAIADNVLIKKGATPAEDFEPEYIAITDDSKTAYVSLQENNAIAAFDLEAKEWIYVKGLSVKDHQKPGNEIDINRDREPGTAGIVNPKQAFGHKFYGVQMPDGISVVTISGKDYVLTANEGDAREWGEDPNEYLNIGETDLNGKLKKEIEYLLPEETDGIPSVDEGYHILGSRSFSIWDADTMELVYDSGSDMEQITGKLFPEYFNANHEYKKHQIDRRSYKKGPEPETVEVIQIDGSYYAVIALERIGGFMVYDITNPSSPVYKDYLNVRKFASEESLRILKNDPKYDGDEEGPNESELIDESGRGDLGAEGVRLVSAQDSPTGYPLVLVGNEVTGTVTIAEFTVGYQAPSQSTDSSNNLLQFVFGPSDRPTSSSVQAQDTQPTSIDFTDISGHWAEDTITKTKGYGISNNDRSFKPNQAITRAEFTVGIVNMLGLENTYSENFSDIDENQWYAKHLGQAKEAGLIIDREDNKFDPNATITRQETIQILVRLDQKENDGASDKALSEDILNKFEDANQVSQWAKEAVLYSIDKNLVIGKSESVLDPLGDITRAETVTILNRIED